MKTKRILIQALVAIILVSMPAMQSCNLVESIFDDEKKVLNKFHFDVDLFDQNIQNGLGTQWSGYSYVINVNGNLGRSRSTGNWVNAGQVVAAHRDSMVYAASISKLITAIAALKVMDEELSGAATILNSPIYLYLPPQWSFSESFKLITVSQVLRHRTGFPAGAASTYNTVKNLVAQPVANTNYAYSNANFGLMRVAWTGLLNGAFPYPMMTDEQIDETTIKDYEMYCRTKLFNPLGITVNANGRSSTLYYNSTNGIINGATPIGDRSTSLASGGWYISPAGVAKLLAYVNHTDQILSASTRQLLYTNFYGLSDGNPPNNTPDGTYGKYYTKSGAFCITTQNGCSGVRNAVIVFPNNVELVFMANSRGGNTDGAPTFHQMFYQAFDNAWVEE
jgi:CubicO group peptidase (beta-lactamase class C family)